MTDRNVNWWHLKLAQIRQLLFSDIMRSLLIPVIIVVFLTSAQAREFTDAKGRKIEAELLAHAGEKIIISRGGKEFVVPIAMFSLDDQQFIKDWIDKNPGAVRFKFSYYTDLEREKVSQGKAPGSMIDDRLKVIPYTYEMIVYNKEVAPAENIEIAYEIYVADFVDTRGNAFTRMAVGGEKRERLQTIAGKFPVAKIPAGGRQDFSRTFDTEFYIDRDGGRTDEAATDKVIGVVIRVLKDGKVIGEHVEDEDSNRMSKTSWQGEKPTPGTKIEDQK